MLAGTELRSVIEEKDVKSIILLGFRTDVQVTETASDLTESFPDVNVMVCSDGTASTPEAHRGAVKKVSGDCSSSCAAFPRQFVASYANSLVFIASKDAPTHRGTSDLLLGCNRYHPVRE